VYIQHTHPRLPWFDGPVHRKAALAQEELSTTFEFPRWVKYLMHNVYDHAAHHVNPRVPFYHLGEATSKLNELAGARAIAEPFSFRRLHQTLKTCRLYDYENHRWLDFDGKPTTGSQITDAQRQAIRDHGPGHMYIAKAS
jgi:omega-6 fatty acid desaturase (delta-12 desaturase)